ncbi:hypothetical protein BB559_005739 [Furculomyces boomerangus]|uniref:DNA damage-binding protein 1 n=1 Tax=Furculomyces boomerangus TaxID=61424 RepID=A0A2T9Y6W3_9FUNG|nr:hypothetical protein BB559_005739 [Furculomyces boomerangus]
MHLYNIVLQNSTAVEQAIVGHFSGKKEQELIIGRNDRLEIWKADPKTGKLTSIHSENLMGKIRSLIPFRLTGGSKDYIVIGSESGAITIMEYNPEKVIFQIVQQEIYGKTGFRRLVPGQYLTCDPRGRAVMIGAVEKQKFVYILNRDSEANLTISSPLEAHKNGSICFDCVGVDVGYENPIFATLEISYTDLDRDPTYETLQNTEKYLVYYELDLGLNHVVRQWSSPVDARSNKLVAVPGDEDGPSGVLVCSEGFITYKNPGQKDHRVPIPRRVNPLEDPSRIPIIVSSVVHRMKNSFFILVQSEDGDLFKVSINYKGSIVSSVSIKYFDTIPVANSLCIFRSGFLFCGSEFGNHQFYQFENLGDETDVTEFVSTNFPNEGPYQLNEESIANFQPHTLSCLTQVSEIESISPVINSVIHNLTDEESPQIYSLCGRGAQSSLKVIRYGLEVSEMAVSELPGNAKAVWTVKKSLNEEFDSYIVISFLDATLVLQIGEEIEEVLESGFLTDSPTLCVQLLADNALLQVTPHALRHIFADGRVNEWKPPPNREIVAACSNTRQVAIALNRGEIVLFELDTALGILSEWNNRLSVESDVLCLGFPAVKEGRLRAPVLAFGCSDQTSRVVSVDPSSCFELLSMQVLSDMPESICLSELYETISGQQATSSSLFNFVGLRNGIMQRTRLDSTSFEMIDTRTRLLGTRPVKLFPVSIQHRQSVLSLSTRSWLNYTYQGQSRLVPMSYDMLEFGSSFSSEQCPEGIVAIAENTLRILTIDRVDTQINQASIPLSYTPRSMAINEKSKNFVIIESDHGTMSPNKWASELVSQGIVDSYEQAREAILPPIQFGYTRGGDRCWASCIRVLNPFNGETLQLIELGENEAAFSIAAVNFHSNLGSTYIAIGTATDVTLRPRTCKEAYILIYKWKQNGEELRFVHRTRVDHVPQALVQFQGKLAAGIGSSLVLYDLGKKQLLKKAQLYGLPSMITRLAVAPVSKSENGNESDEEMENGEAGYVRESTRIIVSDVQESIHYCIYSNYSQQFVVVCDDAIPRFVTSMCFLDRDTIAVADKFGTFCVLRLPEDLLAQLKRNSATGGYSNSQQLLTAIANKRSVSVNTKKKRIGANEAPYKYELLAQYYIGGGDIITSMQSVSWQYGGNETGKKPVLVYTTMLGQVGAMVPLTNLQADVEFFTNLEMHMRFEQENTKNLMTSVGNDHMLYRSRISPVKNVIDGTLCEKFSSIPDDGADGTTLKSRIADSLDFSIEEIVKKLEDTRAMNVF